MDGITGNLNKNHFTINGNSVQINGISNIQKPGMLLIYAKWCGHCTTFKPVYKQLCQKLNPNPNVPAFPCYAIEDSDITDNAFKNALDFKGYPTIKYFDQNGVLIGDYSGPRNLVGLSDNICKNYHLCFT